ncbi:MAG: AMP-binding protein [Deltaproteobacteria bacterium]|nr:AMP-binding protein [Deltaproteobacteria bacterium]MBW2046191.1 AMP-binding protein [Deltaproteobacteria bacterium]MBW2299014.1 AMP-binding protein [Deltaproteobacteria bacterium]
MDAANFPALFFRQVERLKDRVALRRKEYGIWKRISWKEYGQSVREAAAGIIAAGLQKGERVAILGDNRPEWLICHLAAMTAGGVTCGIYSTSSPDQVAYELKHSETKILFVENEEQLDKVLLILSRLDLSLMVVWDAKGLWGFSQPGIIFFDEFMAKGRAYLEEHPECISARMAVIDPEDTAMLIYTSGTTGRPKGAMITHRNILFVVDAFMSANPFYKSDEMLSYLPLAHIYENVISLFVAAWSGGTVNFVESVDTLALNLKEVSPTIFAGVPRIWEKFASSIELKMADSTLLKRILYRLAVQVGLRRVHAKKKTKEYYLWGLLYWPLYWLVLYPLKRQLGFERVRFAGSAAAPAAPELFEYYNALGIPLREGYGQTESTGMITLTREGRSRWGYVGEPIPGCEVKIADDGEIVVKGPNVFKGYFKDPELTASTIKDGWLYTGDIGTMKDGFLKIVDRKKDIIITAGGKNITPAFIENKLKFSPYIQDAVVIGDRRKYLVSLILIDEENVAKYAQDHQIPYTTFADLTQNPEIKKLIDHEVREVNKTLARVETIKRFALIPRRFYAEDGDVTPTQKVKRGNLQQQYRDLIESLYS